MPALNHNRDSTRREQALEHLLIAELLKWAWRTGLSIGVLRPEVDAEGYDLVLESGQIIRHIQLKASHASSSTARVPVHIQLTSKPSGCVIWMISDPTTLDFDHFLYLGSVPGQPLDGIDQYPRVKHSRANAQGVKAERPNLRNVPRGAFERASSVADLAQRLFGEGFGGHVYGSQEPVHNSDVNDAILDDGLTADDIPQPGAGWEEINKFALTCDGYARRADCGDFANVVAGEFREKGWLSPYVGLGEARDCLFFEQRRSRQASDDPTQEDMAYYEALLDVIRRAVAL